MVKWSPPIVTSAVCNGVLSKTAFDCEQICFWVCCLKHKYDRRYYSCFKITLHSLSCQRLNFLALKRAVCYGIISNRETKSIFEQQHVNANSFPPLQIEPIANLTKTSFIIVGFTAINLIVANKIISWVSTLSLKLLGKIKGWFYTILVLRIRLHVQLLFAIQSPYSLKFCWNFYF